LIVDEGQKENCSKTHTWHFWSGTNALEYHLVSTAPSYCRERAKLPAASAVFSGDFHDPVARIGIPITPPSCVVAGSLPVSFCTWGPAPCNAFVKPRPPLPAPVGREAFDWLAMVQHCEVKGHSVPIGSHGCNSQETEKGRFAQQPIVQLEQTATSKS